MAFFDADKSADNSKLNELKIFEHKTENWEKKNILYFKRDDVTIEMAAVIKNKGGKESGKITGIAAKTGDDEPTWDITGMSYDFNKFFTKIANGNLDKLIKDIFAKADTIYGSHFDDRLYGFEGNDSVHGWNGDDRIHGGPGKDKLKGGAGADTFVFDQKVGKKNADKIKDFKPGEDMIELKQKIFDAFDKGTLQKGDLTHGKDAVGDHAQVIYDIKSGKLYYDADGAGGADKEQFAQITTKKDLIHTDFLIG